jgi:predicted RecA/RadA family phage recombinase
MTETLLKLRSDKFDSLSFTAPTGGLTAGQLYKVGDTVGVVVSTVAAGATAVLIYRCPKIVVKKRVGTGIVFAAGAKVYYRSAGPDLTNATTGNVLCGRAIVAAGATDDEVEIDLDGTKVA